MLSDLCDGVGINEFITLKKLQKKVIYLFDEYRTYIR